jgi:hypothetical protein
MAKKKVAPVKVEEVKEVVEVVEEATPAEITKEKVCEFYGISDNEVFD